MWRKGNLLILSGNVNWCSHYGEQYGGFAKKKKPKPRTNIRPCNSTPGYLSEKKQKTVI